MVLLLCGCVYGCICVLYLCVWMYLCAVCVCMDVFVCCMCVLYVCECVCVCVRVLVCAHAHAEDSTFLLLAGWLSVVATLTLELLSTSMTATTNCSLFKPAMISFARSVA